MSKAKTTITGASDDLIKIDGQIREEFPAFGDACGDDEAILAFSDGTLLSIEYDKDGIWRVSRLIAGACEYSHQSGDVTEDNDIATLTGDLIWCVCARRGQYNPALARARGET